MPGATDVSRRGHRRSLRHRGGVAVLGVAALGGAVGVTTPNGGASAANTSATNTSKTTPSALETAKGDGFLPAAQWPLHGVVDWQLKPAATPGQRTTIGSLRQLCGLHPGVTDPNTIPQEEWKKNGTPIIGWTQQNAAWITAQQVGGDQSVWTTADEADAERILVDARTASTENCATTLQGRPIYTLLPGASTDYGVSWITRNVDKPNAELPDSTDHTFMVRSGTKVSMLRVSHFGDDFSDTSGDRAVLDNMLKALKK
jgi:hypothetical protein